MDTLKHELLKAVVQGKEGRFPSEEEQENPEDDDEEGEEESKSPPASKKKGQSYFWGHDEKVEFVKLLHTYGKRWISISENLSRQNRDQQQCRSHG